MGSSSSSSPAGTIIFSTVGRTFYGFDIFSLPLVDGTPVTDSDSEHRLTDGGTSINFNGQFADDRQTVVFVSERTGSAQIYLSRPPSSGPPEQLPCVPSSLFHDRPILRDGRLFFVSAHQPPSDDHYPLYKSWSAVYAADLNNHNNNKNDVSRLSPNGVVDYSPAISESGQLMAVASYGSKPWGGEFQQLDTDIVMFPVSEPSKRTVLAKQGGWPTWQGDSTVFFHRQSEDGWWSIYRVYINGSNSLRVTPPGLHAFTPAALSDGKRIAVATRRKGRAYRHIEILDIESGEFQVVTELVNPEMHHYNPFVSPGSKFIGYHRFRGESEDSIVPNLQPIISPIKSLKMVRINGNFPSVSADGELIAYNPSLDGNGTGLWVVKSDGSKRWNLISGRIAFHTSWSPDQVDSNRDRVIFTSLGGIFQPPHATVQIARVTFNTSSNHPKPSVKILTKEETGNNAFPACSPDGKSVVFRSGRSGHKNLYIMDAVNGEFEVEGGSIRQLTEGDCIDTMPAWSPDGKLIAFSSNRHDPTNAVTFGIYLVHPDGSGLRRLHIQGSTDVVDYERINHVCFSPNGEWLLFTANMAAVTADPVSWPNQFQPYGDLFLVKLDGTGFTRLTCNAYENGTPTWHSFQEDKAPQLLDVDQHDKLKPHFVEPLWITCHI